MFSFQHIVSSENNPNTNKRQEQVEEGFVEISSSFFFVKGFFIQLLLTEG